jgi:hypothetical protein
MTAYGKRAMTRLRSSDRCEPVLAQARGCDVMSANERLNSDAKSAARETLMAR